MRRGWFLGSMAATGAMKQVGFLGRFFRPAAPVVQPIRWALYKARMAAQIEEYHLDNERAAANILLRRLNAEMALRRAR
jgi:hypothetical protein